jgi:hypothetical protein
MKTTLNIHDSLLYEAKAFAAQQRTTLTRLIEEGLRLRLQPKHTKPQAKVNTITLPVLPSTGGQGLHPSIKSLSNKSLYDAADDLHERLSG